MPIKRYKTDDTHALNGPIIIAASIITKSENVIGTVPIGTEIGEITQSSAVNSAHCVSVFVLFRVTAPLKDIC